MLSQRSKIKTSSALFLLVHSFALCSFNVPFAAKFPCMSYCYTPLQLDIGLRKTQKERCD